MGYFPTLRYTSSFGPHRLYSYHIRSATVYTSELSSSPRFNLKRPREQNAFLWSLARGVIENTKITVH
jgi:hypothetical protein